MHDDPQSLDGGDLAEVLFRHKWKIMLFPLAVCGLAAAVILFAPRTYQSEARILLRLGRETVGIDPTVTTGQTVSLQQSGRDTEVQSAMDLLLSRGLAERVVEAVGVEYVLNGGPPGSGGGASTYNTVMAPVSKAIQLVKSIDAVSSKEEALIDYAKALSVDAERNSTVIEVGYETATPEGAQHILATLIDIYQNEYQRLHRFTQSQAFFAEQRDLLREQLDGANARLLKAKNRMGLASVEGRRRTYESQVSAIEQSQYDAEQQLAAADARISDLRAQLAKLPERQISSKTSVPNAGADLLRDQLYALQVRYMDLRARYNDDHPLVRAVSAQVEQAKEVVDQQKDLREETVDDINPIHRELSIDLKQQENLAAGFAARLKTLEDQKRLVMSDLRQLNRDEVELDELSREAELARSKLVKYSENFEQARIDQALANEKISSVTVPQQATLQEKPVSPSKLFVGLAAVALSLGGASSWVVAAEKLNNRIRTEAEAQQALELPVYASIPKQQTYARVLSN